MAKVINQDIPASEVLYDPDPARPYTLGEAYVNIMTEGHHSPVTEGELIVQKTPRQGRPPQRGPGSTAQAPQRACFQCCAQLWRDSPQYFKDCMKEIYNDRPTPVKDKQIPPEWFSTPWSSFLQLCLVKCRQEGGCSFTIYDLITCPSPGCVGATIGYTTTAMQINETQKLTIINPHAEASYIFQLGGGGGTVTEAGLYTAPATNANCDQNATINLVCEERVIDSITIAINARATNEVAYFITEERNSGNGCAWAVGQTRYKCDDSLYAAFEPCAGCNCYSGGDFSFGPCCCYPDYGPPKHCNEPIGGAPKYCTEEGLYSAVQAGYCGGVCDSVPNGCTLGTHDVRTPAMIAAGCCPEALL